jgi:tRNA uridine 5-carbamoylmethylation protein Kti12
MDTTKTGAILILRGLPSVGKSRLAEIIKRIHADAVILASDDFFLDESNHTHTFDKERIQEAHKWNFDRFKKAIDNKTPVIVIDNSNIKLFHYYHYLDYGQRHNYLVSVVTIPHNDVSDRELTDRNIHGVSRETIRRMRKEFQWEIVNPSDLITKKESK